MAGWLDPDGVIDTDIPGVLAGIYNCSIAPNADTTPQGTQPGSASGDGSGDGSGAQADRVANVPGDVLRFLTEPAEPPSGSTA